MNQTTTSEGSGTNTILIVLVIIILLVGGYFLFARGADNTPAEENNGGLEVDINATMPAGSDLPEGTPDNGAAY